MQVFRLYNNTGFSTAYASLDHALLIQGSIYTVTYIEYLELEGIEEDNLYLSADTVEGEIHITTSLGDLVTVVDLEFVRIDDMIEYSATINGKCVDFIGLSKNLVYDIHMLAENLAQNIEDNNLPLNLK
ncbi:MAG: hypothetical protein HRU26_09075 [Psychroserpens sp.]|nr:hypothetical protein [Psychroserpens sp.]